MISRKELEWLKQNPDEATPSYWIPRLVEALEKYMPFPEEDRQEAQITS